MCLFESFFEPKICESVFLDPVDRAALTRAQNPTSRPIEIEIKFPKRLKKLTGQTSSLSQPKRVFVIMEPSETARNVSNAQPLPSSSISLRIPKNRGSFDQEPNKICTGIDVNNQIDSDNNKKFKNGSNGAEESAKNTSYSEFSDESLSKSSRIFRQNKQKAS
ncbi:unnamed protein product [Phyllotreta striolata]|uniref:Uncharacterized protein n=1 Tax=Phyllotreta striolata TaxID=444603 RepID=A0A9N9TNB7_PHYSR|nr:unnamed protein product [Phyllotreta striolata]